MTMKDSHLSDLYAGKKVDTGKMAKKGWHDQGSANFHYGVKREKDLWVKKYNPAEGSDCHVVWLFVIMKLGAGSKISSIATDVCQVYADGRADSLGVPFFDHDYEMVKKDLKSVLVDAGNDAIPIMIPLDVQKFVAIISKSEKSAPVKKIIKTYALRKSLGIPMMGGGTIFNSDDNRIEMCADLLGTITTIFLKSLVQDDILPNGITAKSSRKDVIKKMGKPTSSGEDGWWDRFDTDEYKLHIQYKKNVISQLTIMSPATAP